jgi:hypothetical protein
LILYKIWSPEANLKLRSLWGSRKIIRFSMVGKFLINPFADVFTALALNADPLLIQVALNFEALPTDVATTRSKKNAGRPAPNGCDHHHANFVKFYYVTSNASSWPSSVLRELSGTTSALKQTSLI